MEPIKLNIGCINYKPGYIHIDIHGKPIWDAETRQFRALDYVADARKLPLKDNYADEVYSNEMLEHLGRWECVDALKEWLRVLKPGGTLRLIVPDLYSACNWYCRSFETGHLDEPSLKVALSLLFGGQSFEYDFHKNGFDAITLPRMLESVGFVDIEKDKDVFAFTAKKRK